MTKLQQAYALIRQAQVEYAIGDDRQYAEFDEVLYKIQDLREMIGEIEND